MTLGGLALAVGILVDDATVTIENINWHLEQGKDVETAIIDGARQIVTPAFVSLLCICIVFVPMFFLEGVAALPVRADGAGGDVRHGLLVHPVAHPGADHGEVPAEAACRSRRTPASLRRAIRWSLSSAASRRASSVSAPATAICWSWRLASRGIFVAGFMAFVLASFALVPFLGQQLLPVGRFGPDPDACPRARRHARRGNRRSFRRHPAGDPPGHPAARDRDDGRQHRHAGQRHQPDLQQHRHDRPAGRRHPDRAARGHHGPTADYVRELREALPRAFPGRHLLLPAGRHRQPDPEFRRARRRSTSRCAARTSRRTSSYANRLLAPYSPVPGSSTRASSSRAVRRCSTSISTVRGRNCRADRARRHQQLVVNLAGCSQVAPTYWLNPANGVSYRSSCRRRNTGWIRWRRSPTCRSRPRPPASSRCWAASPTCAATPPTPWSRSTTCSRMVQVYAGDAGARPGRRRRRRPQRHRRARHPAVAARSAR